MWVIEKKYRILMTPPLTHHKCNGYSILSVLCFELRRWKNNAVHACNFACNLLDFKAHSQGFFFDTLPESGNHQFPVNWVRAFFSWVRRIFGWVTAWVRPIWGWVVLWSLFKKKIHLIKVSRWLWYVIFL